MLSENTTPEPVDRRARKRVARRERLLELAADLVDAGGVDGLTMTALAEAADYAPASLYTYFASRSALLAALQARALDTLRQVADVEVASWTAALAAVEPSPAPEVAALARLCAFSDLFLAAPRRQPREFQLQQELLVTIGVQDDADAASVLPSALSVLDVPRRLLAAAVDVGALRSHRPVAGPTGEPQDGAYVRTITWVSALNGLLLADGLTVGMPTTAAELGTELTDALLLGWGAPPELLGTARDLAQGWVD